ncbi:SDR family oxidoreductase [Streptomyces mangrovi]|uniref:SDR family oxidoreductase n=1 Tax=Streptomyces mangrovi TaxID=1206892 RepID=UPI00399CB0AE
MVEPVEPGTDVEAPVPVTGGTGTLGRAVVRGLLARGRAVRVLSRRPRPVGGREPYQWATGDLATGEGADAAVTGAGVIVHCATTLGRGDVTATRNPAEAAHRGGSRPHLVYISIVGVDRVPLPYYRAKLAAERVVVESGLPWSILRATRFHDLIARITDAQRLSPVALALAGVCFQPVAAQEVAERPAALATGEPAGRVPDMGGPRVRDHAELTRATLGARGRRRPVLRLPGAAFRSYRAGGHLAPDRAVGRITYEEYLAGTVR